MTRTKAGFVHPRSLILWAAAIVLGTLTVAHHAHAARAIDSVLLTFSTQVNVTSVTVPPSATISATVNVTTTGSGVAARWRATSWSIGGGAFTCVDHANHDAAGTFTETFNITAPAVAGTYNAEFIAYQDNACAAGASTTFTLTNGVIVDTTAPTVSSINRVAADPTAAASVSWTVIVSESVTGVGTADFALVQGGGVSGASITSVTGSGTTYTVTVNTGTGDGTLGLNLVDDDSIVDPAGNRLGGTGAGNGNFTGQVYTITRVTVSAFDAVEAGAAKNTNIRTKLSSVGFSLDVLALDSSGNLVTSYAGTVTVEIVDAATSGVCGSMTSLQNLGSFGSFASGRKTITPINYTSAAANARIRITDSSAGVTSCSFDNFSIRPSNFSTPTSTFNNSGTSGAPVTTAGGNFDITAVAIVGYNGMPAIGNTKITAHVGADQNGNVSGSFGAANSATGSANGATFTYSEVGNFTIGVNGVFDSTFTAVDAPGTDCTNDFSNALVGGLYGCSFGNSVASAAIGRFRPDHFIVTPGTLTNRQALSCSPASTFTYEGEQLRVTFMLTARNGIGVPGRTQNYTTASGFAQLDGAAYTNFGFGAVDLADVTPPLAATALTARVPSGASSGTWLAGIGSFTVDLAVSRAASPDGPFESFRVGIIPTDTDGVTLRAADLDLDTDVPANGNDRVLLGGSRIQFGRLRIGSASGSQLVPLLLPLETQYWNGTVFVTNTGDSCTTFAGTNIEMSNPTGGLSPVSDCKTSVSNPVTFSNGRGSLLLSKPTGSPPATGGVVVTPRLEQTVSGIPETCVGGTLQSVTGANRAYLQGQWDSVDQGSDGLLYDDNPTTRATFGVYRGSEEVIFIRENF